MIDFWQVHGSLFLICMMFFPRLTMLLATAAPFGLLHWLGWLIAPRLLAAILATSYYWDTNPVLCVFTWIFALSATGGTTTAASKVRRR